MYSPVVSPLSVFSVTIDVSCRAPDFSTLFGGRGQWSRRPPAGIWIPPSPTGFELSSDGGSSVQSVLESSVVTPPFQQFSFDNSTERRRAVPIHVPSLNCNRPGRDPSSNVPRPDTENQSPSRDTPTTVSAISRAILQLLE